MANRRRPSLLVSVPLAGVAVPDIDKSQLEFAWVYNPNATIVYLFIRDSLDGTVGNAQPTFDGPYPVAPGYNGPLPLGGLTYTHPILFASTGSDGTGAAASDVEVVLKHAD